MLVRNADRSTKGVPKSYEQPPGSATAESGICGAEAASYRFNWPKPHRLAGGVHDFWEIPPPLFRT